MAVPAQAAARHMIDRCKLQGSHASLAQIGCNESRLLSLTSEPQVNSGTAQTKTAPVRGGFRASLLWDFQDVGA